MVLRSLTLFGREELNDFLVVPFFYVTFPGLVRVSRRLTLLAAIQLPRLVTNLAYAIGKLYQSVSLVFWLLH